MQKKISIIINCHNGSKYLKNCLTSIINQKYQNFEIIFYNNHSNDDSQKIVLGFNDERIRYFYSDKKLNLYDARNKALEFVSGELVAFLDVDDWWDQNYLSSRVLQFHDYKYDFFYCNRYTFYEKKKKLKIFKKFNLPSGKIYNDLAKDYFISISGLIIRKEIFKKVGLFNKDFNFIGDYDLVMRLSQKYNGHATNNPLLFYRLHDDNFSKNNHELFFLEFYQWFNDQIKLNDKIFLDNLVFFEKKLLKLEIKNLLFKQSRNFNLIKKIIRYPNFCEKLKFFIAFLMPKKILDFFMK